MEKSAICFTWQARTLDYCYEYIKLNILDQIWEQWKDYDIFCCTEDDKDAYKVDKFLKPLINKKIKSSDVEKMITDDYWDLLKRNYIDFIYPWSIRFNFVNFLQQFYKNKCVWEIKNKYEIDNNLKYTTVYRLRFDLLPIDKIDIEFIYNNKKKSIITQYDSLKWDWELKDWIICWDKKSMDVYFNMYNKFWDILKYFPIKVKLLYRFIFKLEKFYIKIYWNILKFLKYIKFSDIIIDNLFKVFNEIQWMILREYKYKNMVYPEKLIYKLLNINNINIKNTKLNLFCVRKNRFLNIFISKD